MEIARVLGLSDRTVRDREKLAYALLRDELKTSFPKPAAPSSSQPKTAKRKPHSAK
jgi:hypothetical protein